MFRRRLLFTPLILITGALAADEPAGERQTNAVEAAPSEAADAAAAPQASGPKMISGMSILGNQEAPKALVIVPWKSSEIGETLGLARALDDSASPVDKEVFMRELTYYEIRSK